VQAAKQHDLDHCARAATQDPPAHRPARDTIRHTPPPRRARYSSPRVVQIISPRVVQIISKILAATVLAGVAAVALVIAAAPAAQLIYTEHTANDATITLPDAVQNELFKIGVAHQSIAVTRVDPIGDVSTSYIGLTPRTGNSSPNPVLTARGRGELASKISTIEKVINSSPADVGATGGRALYAGLTKIDFTGGPVTIISSGLNLANPDNFRSLQWSAPPRELVAEMKKADALPALQGPVTFVLVPAAGAQPQLGQAQKDHLKAVWTSLLTAAGATSVQFIDATATTASSGA
jgi:hypothetical protein